MAYVGIDVHKNQSQLCSYTAAGEVLHQRIDTSCSRNGLRPLLPGALRLAS
jgi:hypothetical protein